MKDKNQTVKILCQGFYPDIVATGELLFELAEKLVNKHNIDISVVTAQPNFIKREKLQSFEIFRGVKIKRLNIIKFNKNSLPGKILNSWSFFINVLITVLIDTKNDWLLIPTCPPLLPLIGTITKFLYGQKYIYLMHDVYPEIAVKLDYIKRSRIYHKIWNYLSKLSLRKADKIIVLSDEMKFELINWIEDIDQEKINVIHNWANEDLIKVIPEEKNYFLDQHSLRGKFIVEYSGNFGKIHEFTTLLNAAKELQENKNVLFLLIGDGGKKSEIECFVKTHNLKNIIILPYQDRSELSYSLGAANMHVLSIEDGYENLAVPSKFYGILASGKPVLFIGNKKCHIAETIENNQCGFNIKPGDHKLLTSIISYFEKERDELIMYGSNSRQVFEKNYTLSKAAKSYLECIGIEAKHSSVKIMSKQEKMLVLSVN